MGALLSGVLAVVLFGLAFRPLTAALEGTGIDSATLTRAAAELAELLALFVGLVLTLITLS